MEEIYLDGESLTLEKIYEYAQVGHSKYLLRLKPTAIQKIQLARDFVLDCVEKNKIIYGITTGFGALSNTCIPKDQLVQLQYNLIRSHCAGVGSTFSIEITRMILLLRANCLSRGHSGVSLQLIERMIEFLNLDIMPVIPQRGSVGASGDLSPLSHLALSLIGEGKVTYQGKIRNTQEVLTELKMNPCTLGPKDGLGLINGTSVMCALAIMAYGEGKYLLELATLVAALSLEGLQGSKRPFNALIHELRAHPGQLKVAKRLRELLEGSEIMDGHAHCNRVQDAYSLRCIPQVHGASWQIWDHAKEVIQREICSVTDNPLIFPNQTDINEQVISGGNFHGQCLAFIMDYMALGVSELANISERRVEKMMNPSFSSLPAFLAKNPGPQSGYMIAHVTAAALVSENKIHSHPASVDSIPTSTDKEDHVSMGVHSGRKLLKIMKNVKWSLSIEMLCAASAIDFLRPKKTSKELEKLYSTIRQVVPPLEEDRVLSYDIEKLTELINKQEF